MGLIVTVYRAASRPDCSNNGASARHDRLCVVNVDGPFDPSADAPAAILKAGNLPGTAKIVPDEIPASRWSMFGGNFAYSSDGRWSEAVRRLTGSDHDGPVAIHDRVE